MLFFFSFTYIRVKKKPVTFCFIVDSISLCIRFCIMYVNIWTLKLHGHPIFYFFLFDSLKYFSTFLRITVIFIHTAMENGAYICRPNNFSSKKGLWGWYKGWAFRTAIMVFDGWMWQKLFNTINNQFITF